ncbi:hypothetical protein KVT40_005824 [Elsinoe batatas]|uniref:DUF7137 domain-containing protein n=1 Tax=Elsinoe batatas TaxID=2601811 RepID=A0A8K0PIQ1_9PEZI|nr:hypothetical protein KVT40_005824 [Elsinoe batatas]
MRPVQFFSSALLCSTVVSAWPWTGSAIENALGDYILPHKRSPQRVTLGNSDAPKPNPTQATDVPSTTASDESSSTNESQSDNASASGSNTRSASGSASGSASRTGSASGSGSRTNTSPTQTTFDPRLPAGGIAMITPNSRSAASYYKIGDYVTFAWNYTSLSVTPSAIDILAYCSKNQQTYTLALNQTIANETGAITWDTKASMTVPLLTETYTLVIHDAAREVTDTPRAGYLGTFNQFTFGMYNPQPYTPLADYVCVTCSGAMTAIEKQSLGAVAVFATMAVLGATWFTGLGALI